MLSIKWKKSRYVVLSLIFMLLLNVTLPIGTPTAVAAQTGIESRVVKISAGLNHSLALKSDGTVVAWGDNWNNQTNVPADLTGVVSIAAGGIHSLALKSDGTVVAWGGNSTGQTNVPMGLDGVVSIAAGKHHSLALKSDGTVVAWGWNGYNQSTVPEGLKDVVSIAAGDEHSLALKSNGMVVAWGANNDGELNVPADLTGVVSIAAGGSHSLALKSDGTVVAWGSNWSRQLNVPEGLKDVVSITAENHSLALKSDGTVVAWGGNQYGETNVPAGLASPVKGTRVDAGWYHSLALKSDGTVAVWGDNEDGQLNVPSGLNGVVSIAAGGIHSLALKSDGTVVAWGENVSGQTTVPDGLTGVVSIAGGLYHSLALKSDGTVVAWGYNYSGQTTVPDGLTGVVSIAAGFEYSLALKADGTVVAWGGNDDGQTTVPGGLTGVVSISAGQDHSLALKSDGTVVAWGNNDDTGKTTVPDGLTGVVSIAGGPYHSLALKSDGTVVVWGNNSRGQTNVPDGLTGVVSIAAGFEYSLALKSDGTVVAWGVNEVGQTTVPGNDSLNGLSLQEGSFDQEFSPTVTSYTYSYIGASVSSVNVTAELADMTYAALYVNNQPQASGGAATVSISGDTTVIPVRVEPYLKPAKTYTITVLRDSTPPVIQFGTNGNESWSQSASTTVTVTDAGSGVDADSLQYVWTQSTVTPTAGWASFDNGDPLSKNGADGDWYLHIKAQDAMGNMANVVSNRFRLDNTAPAINISMTNADRSTYLDNTWSNQDVTISVTTTDTNSVVSNVYSMNGGTTWIPYTAPVTLQDGVHSLTFKAVDEVGNEAILHRTVKISTSGLMLTPTMTTTGGSPYTGGAWSGTSVTVSVYAQAGLSGIASLTYTLDGGPSQNYVNQASLTLTEEGQHTMVFQVEDTAGNTFTATLAVNIDLTAPSVSFGTNGNESWSQSASTTVTVTDAESGVDASSLQYAWTTDTEPPTSGWTSFASGDPLSKHGVTGDWYLHIRAQDEVGHTSNVVSNRFRLDNTAPVIRFGTNGNESWSQSATTTVTVTDAESGVDASSLQYAWTTDIAPPTSGWTSFASGDALSKHGVTGDWYLHIGAQDEVGHTSNVVSNRFRLRAASTGSDSYVPDMKPDTDLDIEAPEPTVNVFHSHIVNEANVVKRMASKVAEAKEANTAMDFTDTHGHWAEKTIDLFIQLQLINGYEDGTFRPNHPITRAEFAVMLNRVFDIQGGHNTSVVLKDMGDNWAKEAIENLVSAGVISGYTDGTFKPNQTITREEMVVMLSRIVNLNNLEKDTTKGNFNDLNGAYAAEEIQAAAQASIVSGKGDGRFDPKSNATRAEALQIILNVLELNPQLKTLLDSLGK